MGVSVHFSLVGASSHDERTSMAGGAVDRLPSRAGSRWVAVTFAAGLLVAILAQAVLSYRPELARLGVAGYAVALALFAANAWGYRRWPLRRPTWRSLLVIGAAGSAAWAGYLAHFQSAYGWAVLIWIVGLALSLVILLGPEARELGPRGKWWKREAVAVALLFGLALALRLVRLGQIPDLMTGDEGSMALEAKRILDGIPANPFGTGWFSHPNLFFYLQAATLRLFGWNLFGLRFPAAILGALGVPAVYLLAKGTFGRQAAWISAFFMAGWGLALQLSRLGLNNSADPLFGALVMAFLQRGLVRGGRRYFVAAGLALGASFYFYHGLRLLVPLVLLALVSSGSRRVWRHWRGLSAFALVALLVAGPLLAYFALHPQDWVGRYDVLDTLRSMQMKAEQSDTGKSVTWLRLAHLGRSAFAFVLVRDRGFFYMADVPMLYIFSGVLFVLGLGLALAHWREVRYVMLLLWIGLTVVFGGWALEYPPQYQRYLIAAPAVCLLIGQAPVALLRAARRIWDWRPQVCQKLVALAAITLLLVNASYYFGVYVLTGDFGDRNTEIADRTARLMADVGPVYTTYFFGAAYMPLSGFNSVHFLASSADWVEVNESPLDWGLVKEGRGALFVVMPERSDELPLLRALFPGGEEWQVIGHDGGMLFTVYQVSTVRLNQPAGMPADVGGEERQ